MNPNVSNILIKGIGAAGLGLILYDAHTLGKIESFSTQKKHGSNLASRAIENTISQNSPSLLESKVRKGASNVIMDEGITDFFNAIGGYVKGFATMLVDHVIPLGLALGTVLTPKNSKAAKGFGIGLLAYGAIFLLRDAFGVLKPTELTQKY